MKFINTNKESVKVRTGNLVQGYSWVTVEPNQSIDISEEYGLKLGLTKQQDLKQSKQDKPTLDKVIEEVKEEVKEEVVEEEVKVTEEKELGSEPEESKSIIENIKDKVKKSVTKSKKGE